MCDDADADTRALLQQSNARLQSRVSALESQNAAQCILNIILGALESHYDAEMKRRVATNASALPLARQFYVLAADNTTHEALDADIEYAIESLWLGRIPKKRVIHSTLPYTLMLHPSQLHDDRPLPLLVDSTGHAHAIVVRHTHRTHSFMCKNDPCLPGLVFGVSKAMEWQQMPNFQSYSATSAWPEHGTLERLASMWLGRAPRSPSMATLVVDSKLVRRFVRDMTSHAEARCHFTCSGQTTLHAYLCLTANDGAQTDIARLPLGTIA